jgi:hypothetical protein
MRRIRLVADLDLNDTLATILVDNETGAAYYGGAKESRRAFGVRLDQAEVDDFARRAP